MPEPTTPLLARADLAARPPHAAARTRDGGLPFRWCTAPKLRLVALVAGLETLWLAAAAPAHPRAALAAFVATHALVALALAVGARLEQRLRLLSRLETPGHARRVRRLARRVGAPGWPPREPGPGRYPGDPTLERAVLALRPRHPRLDAPRDARALAAWQTTARAALRRHHGLRAAQQLEAAALVLHGATLVAPGLRRACVTVAAVDGTPIPGFLFETVGHGAPRAGRPAVLVVPGHGEGIVSTAGLVPSYEQGCALALARLGYVVLTLELRGFGQLGPAIGASHEAIATNALLAGRSYESVLASDLGRGLVALRAHRGVDPARIAVTGASLGGNLTVTLAALHPWVRVAVAQGLADWVDLDGRRPAVCGHGHGALHDPCWVQPAPNAHAWYEDPFLLVAPRPLLLVNSRGDVGDMAARGSWLLERLRTAYASAGAPEAVAFLVEPGPHRYHLAPAIAFLAEHL